MSTGLDVLIIVFRHIAIGSVVPTQVLYMQVVQSHHGGLCGGVDARVHGFPALMSSVSGQCRPCIR